MISHHTEERGLSVLMVLFFIACVIGFIRVWWLFSQAWTNHDAYGMAGYAFILFILSQPTVSSWRSK